VKEARPEDKPEDGKEKENERFTTRFAGDTETQRRKANVAFVSSTEIP
jgi:hypothetical protein